MAEEQIIIPLSNRSLEMCRRVVTTESFIEEAKSLYGDTYDYSKVDYKNRDTRVTVICPIHGDFKVYAREHLDGKRCPICEKSEKFLQKLSERFGNRFLLDNYVYKSSTTPVELICPDHGPFRNLPNTILNSAYGCPICAKKVNEQAHAEAIARKEAAKQAKEAERMRENEVRCNELREDIQNIKEVLTDTLKKSQQNEHYQYKLIWLYKYLVDLYIDVIRYNAKWINLLREEHLVEESVAATLVDYEEGDVVYKYDGDAPDTYIVDGYKKRFSDSDVSFEGFLSHRDCYIRFDGKDLYITHRAYIQEQPGCVRPPLDYPTLDLFEESNLCGDASEAGSNQQLTPKISTSLPADFVAIDFETLYPQRVSACSVGLVKYKEGKIVDRYYSLIRPPFEYEGKKGGALTWVHGFTEERLKDERTMVEILPEIERFTEGLPLVAHNACVEQKCILDTIRFYGISTTLNLDVFYDTYKLSSYVEKRLGLEIGGAGSHSLDVLCKRFDVKVGKHHNAVEDAEMCGNLFVRYKEILDSKLSDGNDDRIQIQTDIQIHNTPTTAITLADLEAIEDNPFEGKVVIVTGFSKALKEEYREMFKSMGASVPSSLPKRFDYLICGPTAGPSKLATAQSIGAHILSEEEFVLFIESLK